MSVQQCGGSGGTCPCRFSQSRLLDAKDKRVKEAMPTTRSNDNDAVPRGGGGGPGIVAPSELPKLFAKDFLHLVHLDNDEKWVCSHCDHFIAVHPDAAHHIVEDRVVAPSGSPRHMSRGDHVVALHPEAYTPAELLERIVRLEEQQKLSEVVSSFKSSESLDPTVPNAPPLAVFIGDGFDNALRPRIGATMTANKVTKYTTRWVCHKGKICVKLVLSARSYNKVKNTLPEHEDPLEEKDESCPAGRYHHRKDPELLPGEHNTSGMTTKTEDDEKKR